ncbi:hypothetical protein HL653_17750 [Sphingomonas sp. AP4-R1]|uniref:DUF5983 family protein n=1 Tax=Sphingomonas sp. AP4-R1 TaxID=2735134 RepID=UPI00149399DC|nr:hypothetical protein [Sphingomonas sp. AP4-R1]QJU59356.1 hypothetical protein HL653_17750 [Sphingomonas sp. AP4-R1]
MPSFTPTPSTLYKVVAFYSRQGVRFARAEFRIDVPGQVSPYVVARSRAEQLSGVDFHAPGLAIFILLRPLVRSRPDKLSSDAQISPVIGCYLLLSTLHVSIATAQRLDRWATSAFFDQPVPVARTDGGWLLSTRCVTGRAASAGAHELPAILEFGRANRCDYVLLDCDGPQNPVLPVHPW